MAGWRTTASTTVAIRAPAALARQTVLDVVAPDEELLAGQPDPLDQLAGDQHAVERDHDVADQPVRARPGATSARSCTTAAPAGQPDREAQPVGVVLVDARPVPRSRGRRVLEQAGRGSPAAGGRRRPSATPGRRRARLRPPGRRGSRRPRRVAVQRHAPAAPRWPSREPLPRAVGRGVVDDEHLGRRVRHVAQPATSRCSSASRFEVTTTATMRAARSRVGHGRHPDGAAARCQQEAPDRSADWLAAYPLGRLPIEPPVPGSAACFVPGLRSAPAGVAPVALGPVDRLGDHRVDLVDVGVGGVDQRGHERHACGPSGSWP